MVIFCYGKKAICREDDCTKGCPHYDGTGGQYLATVLESIQAMTEDDWVEAVRKLSILLYEIDFDLSAEWCHGDCEDVDGDVDCNDDRRKECIRRWLNSPRKEDIPYVHT